MTALTKDFDKDLDLGGQEPTQDARPLSEEDLYAWRRIFAAATLATPRLEADLQEAASLSLFEYQVLSTLCETDTPMTMTDLAIENNSSLSRLSHVARRLEERGIITRTPAVKDKRVTVVEVIPEAKDVMQAKVQSCFAASLRKNLLDRVTPEELAVLKRVAERVLDSVTQEHPLQQKNSGGRNVF